MKVKMNVGERFELTEENKFAKIVSGSAEVYAVTTGDASFRQFYLMTLGEGDAAFPALDEFGEIEVVVSAASDIELEEIPFDGLTPETLKPLMKTWFKNLGEIPWLRLMADKGDDILRSWRDDTVLEGAVESDALMTEFTENEQIFAMFLGMQFGSEDKRLSRRIKLRAWGKRMLVENSIRNLLGEEPLPYESFGDGGEVVGEAVFVVTEVAKAMGMPVENIRLSADTAARLDQVGILRRLTQKGNMQLRLVSLPDGWHKQDIGIMIGYWGEEKQLAALLPSSPEHYRAVTPGHPQGIPIDDETAEQIAKDAFACYAGFPARALKVMDLLKFMFRQCWKADYRTIIITSLVAGLIPLATPIITETIFQDIIPILDRQGLATVTQALMVTSFTTAALSIVRSIAIMRIATKIEITSESALWGRLLSLPPNFFRRYTVGELAGRMGGLGAVKGLVSGNFVGTVFSFIFSFWSIFLMCYYSLKLTAAAIGVWIVYSLFVFFVFRRVLEFQRKIIEASNKTAGTVQQIFAGLAKFRVQGAEEHAYHLWSRDFGNQWNWELKLRWQNNYTSIISSIQPFILTMLLYYIAVNGNGDAGTGGKAVQQGISYAQFMAFSAAYSSFNGTLGQVMGFIGTFFGIQPQLENLRPILQEVPESAGDKADAETLTGAMEVRHLSFAYEGGEEVLHDVSFRVRAGENVAIVGKSGCGKSTLVRCLLGFEKPTKGSVHYDGQDLSELSLPSVRTQMGVVLQNGQLMTGDIYTNIVGTRLLTQDDAWEAAEAAGIAQDISEMPMGMQTVISEGSSNISGGQRQRLLIARALVGKPAILIFDEATSALDNRSQAIVTESLDRLKATRIVIAHRLSTIRGCDRVIVLDEGRVAEVGGFDELMKKGGIFAELVKRQVA
ncbi:NHLP bacteriocin export ABC transporter permease/ATPase subunit [Schwartzia succinivorans]|jgi:ATP-binding cassette subfamily C protein|uniref:ATP-binding cassette, subfamily C n=1 Tax=Schwartzia succinivorans DSM 10502 TaxID=1123243 RepID=A0A1M4Z3Y6_9FIRM|nr:NHLP bacteriocin export ABC transporter permease/ATPase subunit [Schwartzia succinivorans]SHF12668.1 ATP-binding cassette, subfamily C [Schwartzia succinivorans DSM 10502]